MKHPLLDNREIDEKSIGYKIAIALNGSSWEKIAKLLEDLSVGELESARHTILSYHAKALLSGKPKSADIISEFEKPFYDSKIAGFIKACYYGWEA